MLAGYKPNHLNIEMGTKSFSTFFQPFCFSRNTVILNANSNIHPRNIFIGLYIDWMHQCAVHYGAIARWETPLVARTQCTNSTLLWTLAHKQITHICVWERATPHSGIIWRNFREIFFSLFNVFNAFPNSCSSRLRSNQEKTWGKE